MRRAEVRSEEAISRSGLAASSTLAALLACLPAEAGGEADALRTIGLAGFSGQETVVDFTGVAIPATADAFTVDGVTFDSDVAELTVRDLDFVFVETPQASGGPALQDQVSTGPSSLEMRFAPAVNRVGLWLNGGAFATSWLLTAFDASDDPIGARTFQFEILDGFPDPSTFAGVESDTPIGRITLVEDAQNFQFTNIDDVRFEAAPEPPQGAAAFAAALALWGSLRVERRRRRPATRSGDADQRAASGSSFSIRRAWNSSGASIARK